MDRKEGKNVTAGHSSAAIVGRSAKRLDAHVLNFQELTSHDKVFFFTVLSPLPCCCAKAIGLEWILDFE